CLVKVRLYKLVPTLSRWGARGEKVVVQSPVLTISDTMSRIPVKRYSHEEDQNSVCFLPNQDIEGVADGSLPVVSEASTSWVHAHGVALSDSLSSDVLQYKRGDTFWISIGSCTKGYESSVPVINLRTLQEG
ncbi:hypothetical protein BJ875DRAFT_356175, partial [Amylocarpus encephaloides]